MMIRVLILDTSRGRIFPRVHFSSLILSTSTMSTSDPSCHTIVFESSAEYPSAQELRSALEKGSDEVKIDTLRKIIISTINGNPQASLRLVAQERKC